GLAPSTTWQPADLLDERGRRLHHRGDLQRQRRTPDLLTRSAQRMRVTMTNPTVDLTALPPVRVEPNARQRIKKALADSGRRIAVLDDDPTGSQTVHDVAVVTVFDPDEIAAGLGGPGSTC